MSQRVEKQINLRNVAVAAVNFSLKSRNELPPVLMALQYISFPSNISSQGFVWWQDRCVC